MNCKHCGRSFANAPARLLASHEYDCMANPANFDEALLDDSPFEVRERWDAREEKLEAYDRASREY